MTVLQTKSAIRRAERSDRNKLEGPDLRVGEMIEVDEYAVDLLRLFCQEPDPKRHKPSGRVRYVIHTEIDVATRCIVSFRLQPLDD